MEICSSMENELLVTFRHYRDAYLKPLFKQFFARTSVHFARSFSFSSSAMPPEFNVVRACCDHLQRTGNIRGWMLLESALQPFFNFRHSDK
jgi:hypothetical protein